jgi:hypothetical protein
MHALGGAWNHAMVSKPWDRYVHGRMCRIETGAAT